MHTENSIASIRKFTGKHWKAILGIGLILVASYLSYLFTRGIVEPYQLEIVKNNVISAFEESVKSCSYSTERATPEGWFPSAYIHTLPETLLGSPRKVIESIPEAPGNPTLFVEYDTHRCLPNFSLKEWLTSAQNLTIQAYLSGVTSTATETAEKQAVFDADVAGKLVAGTVFAASAVLGRFGDKKLRRRTE
jgi:hypothetical protein